MSIIRKSFKLGIPFGSLYYANSLELFNVSVGSSEAERRLIEHRATLDRYAKCARGSMEKNLDFKFPQFTYDLNLIQYWNCGVYTTFITLSNLNAGKLIKKSTNTLNKLFEQKPAVEPAKSVNNPYEILGVKKTASINEIKRNYKNLIKIWHPDTNPETETKFIEITEAYKLLTDPERREAFDKHRITVDTPNFRQTPDYSRLRRFEIEDEDYFQDESNSSKSFRLNHKDILYKQTISHKAYSNKIVPSSAKYPQLILFYSDSSSECALCSTVAVIWQRITNELQSIGIHLHTINVDKDYKLTQKIGINTNQLPAIIGIVEETVRFYKDDQITSRKVIAFIRRIIRSTLIKKINHANYREFLGGWRSDNKIRILFINQDKNVRLRYLITAYKYRDYAVCGHLIVEESNRSGDRLNNHNHNQTYSTSVYKSAANFVNLIRTTKTNQDILNKYKLDSTLRYMLIFNENTSWPVFMLTSSRDDFKPKTMWESIELNKYLIFPKITSQVNFEEICPVESIKNKRILCSILIASKKDNDLDSEMSAMRDFINRNMFNRNKFKFGYIAIEDQKPFLIALITNQTRNSMYNGHSFKKYFNDENSRSDETANAKDIVLQTDLKLNEYKLSVIVITRRKWDHILFEWLDGKWNTKDTNFTRQTQIKLYDLLIKLSSPEILSTDFSHEAKIIPLIDENEKSLFGRILYKLFILTEHLNEHFTKREILQIISVVLSILFIFLIGYTMQYLVKIEEQKIDENYKKLGKRRPDLVNNKDAKDDSQKLFIHELKGETYYGLVRLLKPGCRTIVLFCDGESRSKLLPKFYKAAYPYRRNKTLMFAYLMVEKNINWYRKILEQALDKQKSLFINPKNCIGTVISLNGFRKYFCVYHAKHTEVHSNMNNLDNLSDSDLSDVESGNLINRKKNPFYSRKNLLIDDFLLDGLPEWLEKLFSSKTHKYYINYWPTQMK